MKWSNVNWEDSSILINSALTYTPQRGVFESTTKTEDQRMIKLPKETMDLLCEYRRWQLEAKLVLGEMWTQSDYILTGVYGGPMSPDTLSGYLKRFEMRYDLPHIHAHKFRHSMASILYFSGADPVSISKRLGHAQVSTTQDMYAHLIRQADTQSAERIADAIFRSDVTPNKKKSG
jgi:integrase